MLRKMKYLTILAAAAVTLFAASSCNIIEGGESGGNTYKPLELTTKSAEFVQQGNDFALRYISGIDETAEKDYIVSPLSMQLLLGMVLDGAQGVTADEICNVLGYGAGDKQAVNEFALSMLRQLPNMDKKTKVCIANAIFVDDGWPLLGSYKTDVTKYYEAEVTNLDFLQSEAALKTINGWCSKHTEGLIPKVLDEVDPNMLAYLLNALYFKGQWKEKFDKSATAEEPFYTESGSKVKVQMMKQDKEFAYTENELFQAVRLPYGNGAFSMTVLLPTKGNTVSDVAKALDTKIDWNEFRSSLGRCDVDLWLPKFETKFSVNLNQLLSDMGMPTSFSPSADFKAMSLYALRLSFVQQDAFIKVDEEGTEAAAVSTAGMMKDTAVDPGKHVVFHADRPFLYLITETSTSAILFAGRYSGK